MKQPYKFTTNKENKYLTLFNVISHISLGRLPFGFPTVFGVPLESQSSLFWIFRSDPISSCNSNSVKTLTKAD